MNKSINLSAIIGYFKRSKLLVFWIALIVLILGEAVVLKGSIGILAHAEPPLSVPTANTQVVRINFDQYNGVIKKLDQAKEYKPSDPALRSPFGIGKGQ
jgi:hypothetical protein